MDVFGDVDDLGDRSSRLDEGVEMVGACSLVELKLRKERKVSCKHAAVSGHLTHSSNSTAPNAVFANDTPPPALLPLIYTALGRKGNK